MTLLSDKKKIAWLDTVRVFASFAIIVAHYLMSAGFEDATWTRRICFDLASLGVFLFFAISGYLVCGSLDRTTSILEFYRRKIIRVVVPFTVAFIFLGTLFMTLGIFDQAIAERSPFYKVIYGSDYFKNLICMFPVDMNLFVWLKIEFVPFVGEWFMAVIILLYVVAPLLKKCATPAPLVTLAVSVIISCAVFYSTQELSQTGRLAYNWWLVLVRIPEFLFGMILFLHREKILRYRFKLEVASAIWLAAWLIFFVAQKPPVGAIFFETNPKVFLLSLPTIFLFCSMVERLNRRPSPALNWFNDFSGISYPIILLQHPMIFLFESKFDFGRFHTFGIIAILLILTWVVVILSRILSRLSAPAETFVLKKVKLP